MEYCQHENRHGDHGAFKNDKVCLVAHQLVPPTTSQLRNSVDASDEDTEVCDDDGACEETE